MVILIVTNNDNNDNENDHIERHSLRFFQSPHYAANCLQQVHLSSQGAVVYKSGTTL